MHSLSKRKSRLFYLRFALFVMALVLFCNVGAFSQIFKKPIEGDSLSFLGVISIGMGFGSFDVNSLNETLRKSKLNTVLSNPQMVTLNGKIPIGKGFLFAMEWNGYVGNFSYTTDTNGSFQTSLVSLELGLNIGYSLVHNNLFMIVPSVGFSGGLNTTRIMLTASDFPFHYYAIDGIKGDLLRERKRQIDELTNSLNLTLSMEAYLKILSFGVSTEEIQGEPNIPISSQRRSEMWVGGYATYNPVLTSTLSSVSTENIGYTASGFNIGVRVMFSTSTRLITK